MLQQHSLVPLVAEFTRLVDTDKAVVLGVVREDGQVVIYNCGEDPALNALYQALERVLWDSNERVPVLHCKYFKNKYWNKFVTDNPVPGAPESDKIQEDEE